jgi:hypothetical protein
MTSPRCALTAILLCALVAGCSTRVPLYSESQRSGIDAQGEVIDSGLVEGGYGPFVSGIDGWEGEITGKPAPGSRFTELKIGMSIEQVRALLGPPGYQGAYVTGKRWIPFFFGADRYRFELSYPGQGLLVFAGGSVTDPSGSHLIWIIHSANEHKRG